MRLAPRPAATIAAATLGAIVALGVSVLPVSAADRKDAWHLDALELTEMHKITQGEGITVAVIDSGVDATHPDLKNNVLPGIDLYDEQANGHEDRSGHGTAMASLIAGHGHGPSGHEGVLGVAPKAKILPVTVLTMGTGNNVLTPPETVASGINWAIDQGADVINVSLTGPHSVKLNQAVERAYQNNVIVVAAVGNKENAIIGSPANQPGSLAVAGTDRDGKPSSIASLPAAQTHLAAPAEDLYQAVPGGGYATITGNSGATALVSGAVALVKSKYPNLNSLDLFKRMVETTRDAGKPGKDFDYGWGQLDLRAALTGEPDGRASRTQAPSQEPQLDPTLARARAQGPAGENEALVMALSIAFILVVLGLIATPVLLLLRYRRRRRATTPAMEAATATRTSATGLPSPPTATTNPSESGPPAHPTDPADDSPWRRPD